MRLYEFITTIQLNENFVVAQREFSKFATELEVKELLKKFRALGKNGAINDPTQRNIDYWIEQGYEKFKLFINTVDELTEIRNKQSRQLRSEEISNDSVCVFSNDKCDAYIPLSHSASRRLGQGSTWCTSASTPTMWDSYVNQQKHIMFKVISKTNLTDNFAIRFGRDSRVHEIRDLTQQLPRNNLALCAEEFTRHTGITVNDLWVAAQDKLDAVCDTIDGNKPKDAEFIIQFYDGGDKSLSANDVNRGGRFLHSVMTNIQRRTRSPDEHMDEGEELSIGLGFIQYINASPLKKQLVRLIDEYWKYVVINCHVGKDDKDAMVNGLLDTGSTVLKEYAEVLSGNPSEAKEKEILSIKNESRRLLLAMEYCMKCTSPDHPANEDLVRLFMDHLNRNASIHLLEYPHTFESLLRSTKVIYPNFEQWLLEACRKTDRRSDMDSVANYTKYRQAVTGNPWKSMYNVMVRRDDDLVNKYFSRLLRFPEFRNDRWIDHIIQSLD